MEYIFGIVPTFCFEFAFNLLINPYSIYYADYPEEWLYFKGDEMIKKFNLMLSMVIYSAAEIVIYTLLVIFLENRTYSFSIPTKNKINQII